MNTKLYDQNSFYKAVTRDIYRAKSRVIIESPFITRKRTVELLPVMSRLVKRGVEVIINTKPFEEQDGILYEQALWSVDQLQLAGVKVLMTVGHHRKLIIIDDTITWEGSLNVLSQHDSCEIMRRIDSREITLQTLRFVRLDRFYKLK